MNQSSVFLLTKEKFRENESLISICESYQISDAEHKNRILALVNTNGTSYALFSFATSTWPPEFFSDLNVDNVFKVDEAFRIETDSGDSINPNRFKIISSDGPPSVFYYNPCSQDFVHLRNDLRMAELTRSSDASFQWVESYQREDLLEINRSIADGSVSLKRRESKLQDLLANRESEYICYQEFKIYTATWNVNGKPPNDVPLSCWLSNCPEPPDIYAVAFQELDLSPKAITFSESRPDPVWIKKVMDGLHPGAVYEELVSVRLVGMMMIIAVRQELRQSIRYATQTVGTGALNFMGNKGGVGVSLKLNEAHICFVNSHLAAHIHEVQRRKEDHDEILRRMQFELGIVRQTIEEHDHIFWIGDLNYRLTENLDRSQFEVQNVPYLLEFDQLRKEMKDQRVFHNYHEGAITFLPTYKYDPGTDRWDSSDKCRAPAWCDRVLWKGVRIVQQDYQNVMALQQSDHKPVYATFTCGVKTIDEQKYNRVHADVLKRVDKYENDNQPQITVEKTDIDFKVIRFNETYTQDFIVANNCHLPVEFEFRGNVGQGGTGRICESWLKVEPTSGRLITGKSLSIRLKLLIDTSAAWRMHRKQKESGPNGALDILVLHVKNGRDIFITVMGDYRPSCFGFSVETLIRLPRPVFKLELLELMAIESSTDFGSTRPNSIQIPREIYLLVDYLYKNGMRTPNLFSVDRPYKNNPNINEIRDYLDVWASHPFDGTPHTAAEALLMLLEASPEPLVSPLEDELLYADTFEKRQDIIKILSVTKKNVFLYICLFLVDLIELKQYNRCDAGRIALLFGQAMLRGKGISKNYYRPLPDRERDDRRTVFMMHILNEDVRGLVRSELRPIIYEHTESV